MRGSYYNEIDPFAAEMLRNLIAAVIGRRRGHSTCEHSHPGRWCSAGCFSHTGQGSLLFDGTKTRAGFTCRGSS